uniref:Peptidase_M1 domain-containing protein n=1 Tax=Panagrellus redivivus TaxID=6233 RepID=A0A7E4ZX28_PANRE
MLILGALLLLFSTAFAAQGALEISLPKSLYATKYDLTVNVFLPPVGAQIPDEDAFRQKASVLIDFTVKEPTRLIVLNADGITVKQNFLWNGRSNYSNLPVVEVKSVQKLYFEVPYILAVGETLQFYIEYTYKIRSVDDEALGLYRSTWVDENKVTHHIASTQFKTIHARKVVPCLDDPTFRSVWSLTVHAPKGYRVDANTQEYQTTNNAQTHRFFKTPSIPSYLLAFAVHDQAYIRTVSPGGFKNGFIGPHEKLRNCTAWFAFTGQMIDTLVDKFKVVKLPFDKMDFIHIGRMYKGAMENPGLITLEPSKFCNYDNQIVLSELIVTHEMLHQWFGNSVTPNGWENIIMSEGLVTYYQIRLLLKRNPNLTLLTTPSMVIALPSNTSIYTQPTSINEVMNVGNDAQYFKSAAIFHMMERMMGPAKRLYNVQRVSENI